MSSERESGFALQSAFPEKLGWPNPARRNVEKSLNQTQPLLTPSATASDACAGARYLLPSSYENPNLPLGLVFGGKVI